MQSLFDYIISTNNRYNNTINIDSKKLIVNTEITERDFQFVNRIGTVLSTPKSNDSIIKKGDVKPVYIEDEWALYTDQNLYGELVYSNSTLDSLGMSKGDVVGFTPNSEYEFNIDGQKLYRILSNHITINYGSKEKNNFSS